MTTLQEVIVPDIGNFDAVEVIEINVAVGESIAAEETLITLESDKASMDIPSPRAGTVAAIKIAVGDKVSAGDVIVLLQAEQPVASEQTATLTNSATENDSSTVVSEPVAEQPATATQRVEVFVPDIGGAKEVTVIEINTAVGAFLEQEETLITLESEKASMELPSPVAGTVQEIKVQLGDTVSEGTFVAVLESKQSQAAVHEKAAPESVASTMAEMATPIAPSSAANVSSVPAQAATAVAAVASGGKEIHATPVIRRLARQFGVDLSVVTGTGRKNRILRSDVENYVKKRLNNADAAGGTALPQMPDVDFSRFGEVEALPLSRIKKISAQNLHRNWLLIPHVTQFDEVDITELEDFRKANKARAEQQGYKLTPLVFLMKAAAQALQAFPSFNASLHPAGDKIIQKKYYHIGVAVDTPQGLVVPVVRNVDSKGLFQLAAELSEISAQARAMKLTASDMQGGCFTLSSLGGIGGTAFTPIINAPEVAILGVSKSQMKPQYQQGEFVPRLMLPLSLSYDHRVIDGAEAARFITYLNSLLSDIRQLLL